MVMKSFKYKEADKRKPKYMASAKQKQVFYAILANKGILDQKENLVWGASNMRTQRCSELNYNEMKELLEKLQDPNPKSQAPSPKSQQEQSMDTMRKKIISNFRKMGYEKDGKADMYRINGWCLNYGHAHKLMNNYSYEELVKLVTQAESVYATFIRDLKR